MSIHPETVLTVLVVIYVLLIITELLVAKALNNKYISDEFAITNLSIALIQQTAGVFQTAIFMAGYIYVQKVHGLQNLLPLPVFNVQWPVMFSKTYPIVDINWNALVVWGLVVVMADFCQYWLHRWSHEINILWAGHIVHHSNTEYNFTVALRQSFIEGFYTWIFYLPLAFLGIPWELFISAYAISLLWQFMVHTRFIGKMGLLENFMSTPSHHRVHHGKNDKYLDKNYGAFFIIWDKLFGTFKQEDETPEYGITVPLTNNNLLWINIHQHVFIWKNVMLSGNWKERILSIAGRPSFLPEKARLNSTEVDSTPVSAPAERKIYIYISFLLTVITGIWSAGYYREYMDVFGYLLLAAYTVTSFVIICNLMKENKSSAILEVMRLLVSILVGCLLVQHKYLSSLGYLMIISAIILGVLSYRVADIYRKKLQLS